MKKQIFNDQMREYLTVCAEKLGQLAKLADQIDAGTAKEADKEQAASVAAWLLEADRLGGCAELAQMLHSELKPEYVTYSPQSSSYIEPKRPPIPTVDEVIRKGRDACY